MLLAGLCLVLVASYVTLAAVQTTVVPRPTELWRGDELLGTYQSSAACAAAAPEPTTAAPVDYHCKDVELVSKLGVCDVPRPVLDESQRELTPVQDPRDDTRWSSWERAWVQAEWPACWRLGWELERMPMEDAPRAETAADLAPRPRVDPAFDEHSPTGPGEGPRGATTVDRP